MNKIIREIEAEQLRTDLKKFKVGDTVKVYAKVKEGNRERLQVFEGTVIRDRTAVPERHLPLERVPAE